jgi:copper chaperone CopZ
MEAFMRTLKTAAWAGLVCVVSTVTALAGDVSVKDVHLCCGACVKDANAALKDIDGISDVGIDRNTKTITFKAADEKAAKKAIDELAEAGFHGAATLDKKELKFPESGAEKGKKVNTLTIEGVHLCCGQCVKLAQEALKDLPGAKEVKIDREAKTVTITGADIDQADAVAALNKGGFHGTLKK